MPRCKDGSWCIDDLCHMTSTTLCGLDPLTDRGEDGDYLSCDSYDEDWGCEHEEDELR